MHLFIRGIEYTMRLVLRVQIFSKMFASVFLLYGFITTAAGLLDNGKLATLNGINYYVGGVAVSKLSTSAPFNWHWTDADLVPLTVIRSNATTFTSDDLEENIAKFTASDDVFGPGFLEGTSSSAPYQCIFN